MSNHSIRWTIDSYSINGELICSAPPEAECHLSTDCSCETWGEIETADDGHRYHAVDHGDEGEVRHYMTAKPAWCNIAEWINSDGALDCADIEGSILLAETPVETYWCGDFYQWTAAK